jgi:hypothetical protein
VAPELVQVAVVVGRVEVLPPELAGELVGEGSEHPQ